jgi:hypothetical protein
LRKSVRKFKSLKIALSPLAPFIRDGNQILRGRPLQRFDQGRPRELIGNWLLTAFVECTGRGRGLHSYKRP